jgi:hypothetical protein
MGLMTFGTVFVLGDGLTSPAIAQVGSDPVSIMKDLYQSQMPVIERAIETASLMLGSDRSRGYCLEMICDFLAGANLDHGDPEMLLFSMTSFFKFLPEEQRKAFLVDLSETAQ